jgi:hypothetical protein
LRDALQEEGSATHVATSDEFRGKEKPVSKDREQAVDAFAGGNAREKHHFARSPRFRPNVATAE